MQLKEHASVVVGKTSNTAQNLARKMPNIGASKSTKRRLLASMVTSQMLYEARAWADMMKPGR